jgi:hypothetical protein
MHGENLRLQLYKGGGNRKYRLEGFGPAKDLVIHEAVRCLSKGIGFNLYRQEVSGVKMGACLIVLQEPPQSMPRVIPILDWNAKAVTAPAGERDRCPLCRGPDHKGGCSNTYKIDPESEALTKEAFERRDRSERRRRKRKEARAKKLKA